MKYISFIGYGLLAISVIVIGLFLGTGDAKTLDYPYADLMVQWTIAMIWIAAAATVLLPLLNIVKNPKSMTRSLIGVGIVAVMLLVCYLLASDAPIKSAAGELYENKGQLLLSDAGLYAIYITLIISILSIVGGEIYKVFKK